MRDPIPELKELLNDGKILPIKNYPKKFSRRFRENTEDSSIHGHLLVRKLNFQKIETFFTPIDKFFVRNHLKYPDIDMNSYKLSLTGCFEKETHLSLEEIKRYKSITRVCCLECTGNQRSEVTFLGNIKGISRFVKVLSFNQLTRLLDPRQFMWWIHFLKSTGIRGGYLVSNGVFTGVKLFDILKDYPLGNNAKEIVFEGMDKGSETVVQQASGQINHYARSFEIEELKNYEPILCYEMNGEALTADHGYPLRLIIPKIYGGEQVKWLGRIIATQEKYRGYYQTEYYGYKIDGETVPVHKAKPKSAVIRVLQKGERVTVYGIAWGGVSSIERVEISIDNMETWNLAELLCKEIDNSWLFWKHELSRSLKGQITITPRVFCVNGDSQPFQPDKYSVPYGNNSVFPAVINV